MRSQSSRLAPGGGSSSSNSTPPVGITKISDAVYKFGEPTMPIKVEIVFIHGLQFFHYKDAYWRTWICGKGSKVCWPLEWLNEDFPGARIWSLSYDSCAWRTDTTGRMDVYALGESLVQNMVELAKIGEANCPIVFVCHCLGGLVVKEIVIQAHEKFGKDRRYVNFLRNVGGFFFYATPHEGSLLADLASHVPFWKGKSKLVEQLRVINDSLGRLNADFERIERDHFASMWKFSVVAETHKTTLHGFSAKVVEEASARHGYQKFLPIAADHFGVCTPETRVSSSFQVLRNFVEEVVEESALGSDCLLELPRLLVGTTERLQEIKSKLGTHSSVGVVGMGGIGKTTLSKQFYNKEKMRFEKSCFLEDVKSTGVEASRKKLFCDLCNKMGASQTADFQLQQIKQCIMSKKVLVVVDDVGSEENLKALLVDAFKDGGKGSRVIVTTRREDILIGHVDREGIVDLEFLNDGQAFDLFSHHAFEQLDEHEKAKLDGLAKDISKACGGLPLSIEVMGQFLKKYSLDPAYADEREGLWEKALDKLQKAKSLDGSADDRLWARLKISYDDLDEDHKSMFLDFACIFSECLGFNCPQSPFFKKRWTLKEIREYLGRIWGDPIGVQNLIKRSLIKWNSDKGMLVMHDQLRDMGRSISKTTRIWKMDECLKLVEQNKSSTKLEGLFLHDVYGMYGNDLAENEHKVGKKIGEEVECFEKLRLLNMTNVYSLQVVEHYISLCSEELRWLLLNGTKIMSTSIQSLGLFHKLRVLQMWECEKLQQLPESIGRLCDLMELDLSHCSSLQSLPESMGKLKSLKILKIWRCSSLKEIPEGVGKLPKLEYIYAEECTTLETLCEFGTEMQRLMELDLSGCKNLKTIKSLGKLRGLKRLNLNGCGGLHIDNLCGELGQLLQLQYLDLLGCSKLGEGIVNTIEKKQLHTYKLEMLYLPIIPEFGLPACPCLQALGMKNGLLLTGFLMSPDHLSHLEHLHLTDNSVHPNVKMLPDTLCDLEQLKRLHFEDFIVLERLPENLGQLSLLQQLRLFGSSNLVELPMSLVQLSQLQNLDLRKCAALTCLPESLGQLSELRRLDLMHCKALACLPESLGQLSELRRLELWGCSALTCLPESLGQLSQLRKLDLRDCAALTCLPESLGQLSQLSQLELRGCSALTCLPESLGQLSQLSQLELWGCAALTCLPESLGQLSQLQNLDLWGCSALTCLPESLGQLSQLWELELWGCAALTCLPESLGQLSQLRKLDLRDCAALTCLPESLGQLSQLSQLELWGCAALTCLPESLGQLSQFRKLELWGCAALTCLPESLGQLSQLRKLDLRDCAALTCLPESLGQLSQLSQLELWVCAALTCLPESLGQLSQFRQLELWGCAALTCLPESLGQLSQLQRLNLSFCEALTCLPESLGQLSQLWELELWGCSALTCLPESLGQLSQLSQLELWGCAALTCLPESLGQLSQLRQLELWGCAALTCLPESLGQLSQLRKLDLRVCAALTCLPESLGLLSRLEELNVDDCGALTCLPESLGQLFQLQRLYLSGCVALTRLPESLGQLSQLQRLNLSFCEALTCLPESLGQLSQLNLLTLDGSKQWREVDKSTLQQLEDGGCCIDCLEPEGTFCQLHGLE